MVAGMTSTGTPMESYSIIDTCEWNPGVAAVIRQQVPAIRLGPASSRTRCSGLAPPAHPSPVFAAQSPAASTKDARGDGLLTLYLPPP